jgi:hypothetical protein
MLSSTWQPPAGAIHTRRGPPAGASAKTPLCAPAGSVAAESVLDGVGVAETAVGEALGVKERVGVPDGELPKVGEAVAGWQVSSVTLPLAPAPVTARPPPSVVKADQLAAQNDALTNEEPPPPPQGPAGATVVAPPPPPPYSPPPPPPAVFEPLTPTHPPAPQPAPPGDHTVAEFCEFPTPPRPPDEALV